MDDVINATLATLNATQNATLSGNGSDTADADAGGAASRSNADMINIVVRPLLVLFGTAGEASRAGGGVTQVPPSD